MVYIWRKQLTGVDAQQNKIGQGRFVGPARILATEQKRDSPGSSVWLVRGRRLLKCCPEQLRHASVREKILTELHDQHQVPQWDFPKVAQELGGNEYEDITEVPTIGEWKRARDPASEWQPTVRLNKKSGAPIPEVPAKGSDDLMPASGSPLAEVQGPRERRSRSRSRGHDNTEPMSHGFVKAPHWSGKVDEAFFIHQGQQQEFRNSVFSVEIDLPQTRSSSERAFKDLQAYFTTAMKRRAVEISERRLTPEEKKQFDQAKAIEVNNFISARAFEALAPEHKFSREDVINMRWILTWKVKPDGIARKIEQYFRAIWIQNMKTGQHTHQQRLVCQGNYNCKSVRAKVFAPRKVTLQVLSCNPGSILRSYSACPAMRFAKPWAWLPVQ